MFLEGEERTGVWIGNIKRRKYRNGGGGLEVRIQVKRSPGDEMMSVSVL